MWIVENYNRYHNKKKLEEKHTNIRITQNRQLAVTSHFLATLFMDLMEEPKYVNLRNKLMLMAARLLAEDKEDQK